MIRKLGGELRLILPSGGIDDSTVTMLTLVMAEPPDRIWSAGWALSSGVLYGTSIAIEGVID
ncbi:hypothetical protein [Spirosoma agri]|uniref:Uncharacterized protein n=1 Tax=Spirosoma agri TaxID=1987381 RepID=A0A6M0IRH7_9BACT|nr:hypothetical protein [Spirosoma agri]NEU70684.1 hypothetical protein [Spirosoma agri]